ncbi:MAG: sodium:calcium antiporter, partial [Planctomycetaceae bacterium]
VAVLLVPPQHVLNFSSIGPLTLGLVAYGISLLRRAMVPAAELDQADGRALLAGGIARFCVGSVLLYCGAELVLHMSIRLAEALEISEAVIGLTIVAAGTSVPDITASIVATLRKEHDIAVGNLLGSNISNILFVLNGTLWVAGSDVRTDWLGTVDYVAVLAVSALFSAWSWSGQRLPRGLGVPLLLIYVVYMGVRVFEVGA